MAAVAARPPAPALILWGRNDPFFPEPGARAYLRDLPGAELRVFDTGHFALEENLPEIAPLVAAFLDKTGPSGQQKGSCHEDRRHRRHRPPRQRSHP